LQLTHDPAAFTGAQRELAEAGLDDVAPSTVLYVLFFNHPSPVQRLAMAEDWARQHPHARSVLTTTNAATALAAP
jgi:hypothetical protein